MRWRHDGPGLPVLASVLRKAKPELPVPATTLTHVSHFGLLSRGEARSSQSIKTSEFCQKGGDGRRAGDVDDIPFEMRTFRDPGSMPNASHTRGWKSAASAGVCTPAKAIQMEAKSCGL
jgi:hypothetical protein